MCWERPCCAKAVLCMPVSAPTQLRQSRPAAWNPSRPRDKEPTQPVLGLLPCVGLFPPASCSRAALSLCVRHTYHMAPRQPQCTSLFPWEGMELHPVWHERGVCRQSVPCHLLGEACFQGALMPLLKLILLSVLYVSKVLCSVQGLAAVFLGD